MRLGVLLTFSFLFFDTFASNVGMGNPAYHPVSEPCNDNIVINGYNSCLNDSGVFQLFSDHILINGEAYQDGYVVEYSSPFLTFVDPNDPNTKFSFTSGTAESIFITATLTDTIANCSNEILFSYIIIDSNELLNVSIDPDTICESSSILLTPEGILPNTFVHWSVISGDFNSLSCDSCQNTIVQPAQTTVYKLDVLTDGDCMVSNTVEIVTVPHPIVNYTKTDPDDCDPINLGTITFEIENRNPNEYIWSWVGPDGYTNNTFSANDLQTGIYEVTISHHSDPCITIKTVELAKTSCNNTLLSPDTISITIPYETQITTCLDDYLEIEYSSITQTICNAGSASTAILTPANGFNGACVNITAGQGFIGESPDTLCVINCFNNDPTLCDTTYIIINVATPEENFPYNDTIYISIPQNLSYQYCLDASILQLNAVIDTVTFCSNNTDVLASFTPNSDVCIDFISTNGFTGLITEPICVLHCYVSEPQVCDTTYFYINIEENTSTSNIDTMHIDVDYGTTTYNFCVDEALLDFGNSPTSVNFCGLGDVNEVSLASNNTQILCFDVDINPTFQGQVNTPICLIHCYNDQNTVCDTTYVIFNIVPNVNCTPLYSNDTLQVYSGDCTNDITEICLPISIDQTDNYEVYVNGNLYQGTFGGCNFDSLFTINYGVIPSQGEAGPYSIEWSIDGVSYTGTFNSINELFDTITTWNPAGNWMLLDNMLIIAGGSPNFSYGDVNITQILSGSSATLGVDVNFLPRSISMFISNGLQQVNLVNTVTGCRDSVVYDIICVPKISIDTSIIIGQTDTICLSDLGLTGPFSSVTNTCPQSSGTNVTFTIDEATNCIIYTGLTVGADTACIVACDTSNVCTLVEIIVNSTLDTSLCNFIPQDTVGVAINDCLGAGIICLNINADSMNLYTVIDNGKNVVGPWFSCDDGNGSQLFLERGTHDIIITKPSGCSDTLTAIVACVNSQIFYDTLNVDSTLVQCFNTEELPGQPNSIINLCESSSGQNIEFVLDGSTFCVQYTGILVGTDTACIQVCDNFGICDTLIMIVTAIPNSPPNLLPIAVSDVDTTLINVGVDIMVLMNDTINGILTNIYFVNNPSHGTVTLNSNMKFSYIPNTDYCDDVVPDVFSYAICNSFGCDTAMVFVLIQCQEDTTNREFEIFNGFSPNGDGMNEVFFIKGIEFYPNNTLCIYNRWGNEVYKAAPYKNDWNGTWTNKILPDGTYFYIFDNGEGKTYHGYLQIFR